MIQQGAALDTAFSAFPPALLRTSVAHCVYYYVNVQCSIVIRGAGLSMMELTKVLGQMWRDMPDADKEVCIQSALSHFLRI